MEVVLKFVDQKGQKSWHFTIKEGRKIFRINCEGHPAKTFENPWVSESLVKSQ